MAKVLAEERVEVRELTTMTPDVEVGVTCWLWDLQISLYTEAGGQQFLTSLHPFLFGYHLKSTLELASFDNSFSSWEGFGRKKGGRRDYRWAFPGRV